jgi:hypothetical protein
MCRRSGDRRLERVRLGINCLERDINKSEPCVTSDRHQSNRTRLCLFNTINTWFIDPFDTQDDQPYDHHDKYSGRVIMSEIPPPEIYLQDGYDANTLRVSWSRYRMSLS